MLSTLQNSGMALSIGIFFSTLIAGLAYHHARGPVLRPDRSSTSRPLRPPTSRTCRRSGTLFAAFLGYNPMQKILGPHVLAHLPPGQRG